MMISFHLFKRKATFIKTSAFFKYLFLLKYTIQKSIVNMSLAAFAAKSDPARN